MCSLQVAIIASKLTQNHLTIHIYDDDNHHHHHLHHHHHHHHHHQQQQQQHKKTCKTSNLNYKCLSSGILPLPSGGSGSLGGAPCNFTLRAVIYGGRLMCVNPSFKGVTKNNNNWQQNNIFCWHKEGKKNWNIGHNLLSLFEEHWFHTLYPQSKTIYP